jgi:hypothetical protein
MVIGVVIGGVPMVSVDGEWFSLLQYAYRMEGERVTGKEMVLA